MTVVRYLHLVGIMFFVGGQLAMIAAIRPVLHDDADRMREVARRFGIGSAAALVLIVATGAAMASHYDVWDSPTLHAKIGLLVLVFVLTGLHARASNVRVLSLTITVISLVIVYLGVYLAHA